jgi:RNA polymerase sigma-70 factor, ECF subfamily
VRPRYRLVSRLQNSDFERLALPLLDPLYNFARWLTGDADDAQDLVHETFVKALRSLSSFEEGTNFRAWMFRILRNTFLTSRTSREHYMITQEAEEGFEDSVVNLETPELVLIRGADAELVRQAIGQLSPVLQQVVLLADLEDMNYREIAAALAIPIGTVMSRLARGRKQIREFILQTVMENHELRTVGKSSFVRG